MDQWDDTTSGSNRKGMRYIQGPFDHEIALLEHFNCQTAVLDIYQVEYELSFLIHHAF